MPEDMTPNSLVQQLVNLANELNKQVGEYKTAQEKAAATKRDAEVAEHRAYLNADGTAPARTATARLASSDERYAADLAERMVLAHREAMRSLQVRIEVGRTAAATLRSEMSL